MLRLHDGNMKQGEEAAQIRVEHICATVIESDIVSTWRCYYVADALLEPYMLYPIFGAFG